MRSMMVSVPRWTINSKKTMRRRSKDSNNKRRKDKKKRSRTQLPHPGRISHMVNRDRVLVTEVAIKGLRRPINMLLEMIEATRLEKEGEGLKEDKIDPNNSNNNNISKEGPIKIVDKEVIDQ